MTVYIYCLQDGYEFVRHNVAGQNISGGHYEKDTGYCRLLLICVKEGLEYGRIKDVLFDPGMAG